MAKFSARSRNNLGSVKQPLQDLFNEVIKEYDCSVLEGKRTAERQQQLYAEGKSHTLNSKHLTGDAVDVMPYPIEWDNECKQHDFATFVYDKAMRMGIRVRWGGRFRGFYDSPHWELIDD